jgi:hypothetical protein
MAFRETGTWDERFFIQMVPMDIFYYTRGHVGIKINNQVGPNFQTKKELRQGDPLSPLLFNIVVDMLAILIKRPKMEGQIDGLSILQYTDDTIIFLEHGLEKAKKT